jgi:hypothetical protein
MSNLVNKEYLISKSVVRSPLITKESPHIYHMVLGSCTGKSTSYLVDTDKKSVVYFDTIVKSEGSQQILTCREGRDISNNIPQGRNNSKHISRKSDPDIEQIRGSQNGQTRVFKRYSRSVTILHS